LEVSEKGKNKYTEQPATVGAALLFIAGSSPFFWSKTGASSGNGIIKRSQRRWAIGIGDENVFFLLPCW